MRVYYLMVKDLKQLLQDWRTVLFLVVMPVGFTLVLGFIFGGFDGQESDPRLPVALIDADQSAISASFIALVEASEVIRLDSGDDPSEEDLRQAAAEGDLAALILIPADYGQALLNGEEMAVTIVADDQGSAGATVQAAATTAANRLNYAALSARLSVDAYLAQRDFSSPAARASFFQQTLAAAIAAWDTPPITTVDTYTGQSENDPSDQNAFIQSSPAMMMQFAIAGLIGSAEIIVMERKSRALQRMLTTGIARFQILLGHFLAMTAIILGQILLLVVFGQLFLRLNYAQAPIATLLISVAAAAAFGGLGLLIGALAKTSESVAVFALLPMFLFSGLGGAWVPLELTSETVQFIGHLTPVAWGIEGFKNILARGMGLDGVWLPALALLGFAALFFALAAWRFEFEG